MNDIDRIPLDFSQRIVVDSYTEGIKSSLASSDSACEKILTAAISLTTVYGAVIALVAPKDEVADIVTAIPFIGFGLAALACMWGQSCGIEVAKDQLMSTVNRNHKTVVQKKRWAARGAVFALAVSLIVAGFVLSDQYGKQPQESGSRQASITLSEEVYRTLSQRCDGIKNPVRGELDDEGVSSSSATMTIKVKDCPSGPVEFAVPVASVTLVQYSSS